jgi:hypothetical protein
MREKLEQIPFGYAFRFRYMQTNYEGEWGLLVKKFPYVKK